MHKVGRDRFVALWVLEVRALGAEMESEWRDSVVFGDRAWILVSICCLFGRRRSSVVVNVAYRN